jgi:hypothetical protein
VPARVLTGALALSPAGAACFASNLLASAYCLDASGLRPLPGVPFRVGDALLLGNYQPGTSQLDGELRAAGGGEPVAALGPFLALVADRAGLPVVLRPSGRLEWLDARLAPEGAAVTGCGDGFVALAPGVAVCSSPAGPQEADGIGPPGRPGRPVAGSVLAMAEVDLDGAGRSLAVAAVVRGGPSRLSILERD